MVIDLYLQEPAASALSAARGGGRQSGVTSWPEAVNYLLATYATPATLREAVSSLKAVTQKPGETEVDYGTRLRAAASRCDNVFTNDELLNIYVDGADARIRSLLARHRETLPRGSVSLDAMIAFARDEGDALRARYPRSSGRSAQSGARVNMVSHGSAGPSHSRHAHDMVGLISGDYTSQATDELPSTVDEDQACLDEAVLYGEHRRGRQGGYVPAQPLAYETNANRFSRPGWVNRSPDDRFICHTCYAFGHVSTQCTVNIGKAAQIVRNYETLTEEQRKRVPRAAYDCTKAYAKAKSEEQKGALSPSPSATGATSHPNAGQVSAQPTEPATGTPLPKND